jgi:hypothetical protein
MGFCVGAYALERWLGLNCFSFSLLVGSTQSVVAAGAPVVVDVFIPSGDARAPYIPTFYTIHPKIYTLA